MDYSELKNIVESKKNEVQNVASELEMTPNGFRESIKNETIQLKKLRKLCDLLEISPMLFFSGISDQNLKGGSSKSKDIEISLLRESLKDKEEIIQLLRDKLYFQNNGTIAASPGNKEYKTK